MYQALCVKYLASIFNPRKNAIILILEIRQLRTNNLP